MRREAKARTITIECTVNCVIDFSTHFVALPRVPGVASDQET